MSWRRLALALALAQLAWCAAASPTKRDRRQQATGSSEASSREAVFPSPLHRGFFLRTSTRRLADLAAFAAQGSSVVLASVFTKGHRELAAVSWVLPPPSTPLASRCVPP